MEKQNHERPYVLTCDLAKKVKAFERIGLKVPAVDDPFFTNFQAGLAEKIATAHLSCGHKPEVQIFPMDDLANRILAGARKLLKGNLMRNGIVVSTCTEIASGPEDLTLEVNRFVDYDGNYCPCNDEGVGIGPRPGCRSLEKQVDDIKRIADGRPVVLVQDGIFTGTTLSSVVTVLKKAQVRVEAIVVGFGFEQGVEKLKTVFDKEIVEIFDMDPMDWVSDRDFFPFVPESGKVVGHLMGNRLFPVYNQDGCSFSIPFILPFSSDMQSWASVPLSSTQAISEFCLVSAKELFARLEKENKREILIRDLVEMKPKISVPHRAGNLDFTVPETSAYNFVNKTHIEVWSE